MIATALRALPVRLPLCAAKPNIAAPDVPAPAPEAPGGTAHGSVAPAGTAHAASTPAPSTPAPLASPILAPPAPAGPSAEALPARLSKVRAFYNIGGTIGAATGADLGRVAVSAGAGIAAGLFAATHLGASFGVPIGCVASVAALALEMVLRPGFMVGGIIGGALGAAHGFVLGHLPFVKPNATLENETRGFSFRALPRRLYKKNYTSHPRNGPQVIADVLRLARPGDILITHSDRNYMTEDGQRLMGATGKWAHAAFITEAGNTCYEVLATPNGAYENPVDKVLVRDHHAMLLRPRYKDDASRDATLAAARDQLGKARYDPLYNFRGSKFYCTKYVFRMLAKGSPEIRVTPSSFLGKKVVTPDDFVRSPDIDQVYTTGSHYWLNRLSKFC